MAPRKKANAVMVIPVKKTASGRVSVVGKGRVIKKGGNFLSSIGNFAKKAVNVGKSVFKGVKKGLNVVKNVSDGIGNATGINPLKIVRNRVGLGRKKKARKGGRAFLGENNTRAVTRRVLPPKSLTNGVTQSIIYPPPAFSRSVRTMVG